MRPIPDRLLLGPGPSPVDPAVLQAMSKPLVGHLDPAFLEIMDDVATGLRTLFHTDNMLTFPISGTGSAGMEAALLNVLEPGDRFVVGANGVFGRRMAEVARRAGADVVEVVAPWGEPVPTDELADTALAHNAKVVGIVHAETSTGVRQPVEEIRDALGPAPLLVVDAVTSLGGIPLYVDDWGIDVCYSGTQKCLSVPPGLAPITFSQRAADEAAQRVHPVRSWYLDLGLLRAYWDGDGGRAYHHTAPISMIYALATGIDLAIAEGDESRWKRHAEVGRMLQEGLIQLGFEPVPREQYRLPQLTAVTVPNGVDEADARRSLLTEHGIEIGGGLGDLAGKAWRIGMMGFGAKKQNAIRVLQAIRHVI